MSAEHSLLDDRAWLASAVYERGLTYEQIGRIAGRSRPSVHDALVLHNLIRRDRPDLFHPLLSDREWLVAAIESGPTYPEIAVRAAASEKSVRKWLIRHDLQSEWRDRRAACVAARRQARIEARQAERAARVRKYPLLHDPEALAAAAANHTVTEIAREVGCTVSAASRALDRHGLIPVAYVRPVTRRPQRITSDRVRTVRMPHPSRAEAVERYRQGERVVAIAEALGVSPGAVSKWANAAGLHRYVAPVAPISERIAALLRDRMPTTYALLSAELERL